MSEENKSEDDDTEKPKYKYVPSGPFGCVSRRVLIEDEEEDPKEE